jgi:hypothetical protein
MNSLRVATFLSVAATLYGPARAQSAHTLSDGKTFAESIAPRSKDQIVNPSGVNAGAWSAGATAMPADVPSGLGTFSSPLTSSPLYGTSGAQGALAGLGNAKIHACQSYMPTGDPIADEECAAVRFMNRDCVPLDSSGLQVVGAAGVATATGASCSGTYGAGQSNFGYQNAITPRDPIFHLSQSAQNNAALTADQNCVPTQVVTTPAQYETNQCSKTISTDLHVCTQELAVAVTTSFNQAQIMYSCDAGVLQGQYCVSTSSSPATSNYSCPDGGTLDGISCVTQTTLPASTYYTCASGQLSGQSCVTSSPAEGVPSCPPPEWSLTLPEAWTLSYDANHVAWCTHYAADHDDPIGTNSYRAATSYACPGGGTLSGATCTTTTTATLNYKCDSGTLSGSSCISESTTPASVTYTCASGTLSGSQCLTSTNTPATPHYSCPAGAIPVGDQCVSYSTVVSWIDNCTPYEQSAGTGLGNPT